MPPSKESRAARKGTGAPDGIDIKAIIVAFYDDLGCAADVQLFQELTGSIVVEVNALWYDLDNVRRTCNSSEVWDVAGGSLDARIMIQLHKLWHMVDRAQVHYPRPADSV